VRYTYIRPFVDAAQTVLEQVLSERAEAGELELISRSVASRGVTTIVGVTGEAEGRVFLDMTTASALLIVKKMNGENPSELDDLGRDTLSELTSMITGRAVAILNDAGHHLKVTPPTLLTGDNLTISNPELETLVVPLQTFVGEVVVNVAIATG
jgi:chemotaxis protein CheX